MAAIRTGADRKGISPEKPRYRAGLGAWVRALKLKPSLEFPLSEVACESPWQRHVAGQPTLLILNNLPVDLSLEGVNTEEAGDLSSR